MAAKILMVGSIMMDLILQMPRIPHPSESLLGTSYSNAGGGKGSNSAVAAAKAGGDVSVCGTLGQDANGEALLGMLQDVGIDVSNLKLKEGANTGMAVIMLEEDGMNRLAIYTGANNDTSPESVEAAFKDKEYDALMMQLEIPLESNVRAFELAKERGMITCLDAGPAQDYPIEKFQGITILSPNETETEALVGILPKDDETCIEACKILHERSNCKYVVLKMGDKGSFIYGEGICQMVPTFKVEARSKIRQRSRSDLRTASGRTAVSADKRRHRRISRRAGIIKIFTGCPSWAAAFYLSRNAQRACIRPEKMVR